MAAGIDSAMWEEYEAATADAAPLSAGQQEQSGRASEMMELTEVVAEASIALRVSERRHDRLTSGGAPADALVAVEGEINARYEAFRAAVDRLISVREGRE